MMKIANACYYYSNSRVSLMLCITLCYGIAIGQTEEVIFDGKDQGIVDITNYTFPEDTEKIHFARNRITKVPKNVFKGMPNILIIGMRHNLISVISNEAFINVPSLQRLYFKNNKLHCISKIMFVGLYNLKELELSKNKIVFIENLSFAMMNNLEKLSLQENNLETLSELVFGGIVQPKNKNIHLSLHNNSLQCDTRLCWINDADWIDLEYTESTNCTNTALSDSWSFKFLMEHGLICGGKYMKYIL